jgi:serine/threonine protein phosphatase PrpC
MDNNFKFAVSGITDTGCVRAHNEDAYLIREELPLFVVADGVGGAAAGEVASELFTTSCTQEFERYNGWNEDLAPLISRCFINANQNIRDHAQQFPDTKGMGCTAEILTFYRQEYIIGHVGDSRTYLLRDGHLERLTKDHSYVQEQIDLGLLNETEADSHWLRNAIYRAVGQSDELEVDIVRGKAKQRDCYLLCSDGLTDMVAEDRIRSILKSSKSLLERNEELIEEAKQNGGRDNVTVVLCELEGGGILSSMKSLLGK